MQCPKHPLLESSARHAGDSSRAAVRGRERTAPAFCASVFLPIRERGRSGHAEQKSGRQAGCTCHAGGARLRDDRRTARAHAQVRHGRWRGWHEYWRGRAIWFAASPATLSAAWSAFPPPPSSLHHAAPSRSVLPLCAAPVLLRRMPCLVVALPSRCYPPTPISFLLVLMRLMSPALLVVLPRCRCCCCCPRRSCRCCCCRCCC